MNRLIWSITQGYGLVDRSNVRQPGMCLVYAVRAPRGSNCEPVNVRQPRAIETPPTDTAVVTVLSRQRGPPGSERRTITAGSRDVSERGRMEMLEIIKSLFGLAPNLLALPKERRELRDNALRSILVALDETYLYYRDMNRGQQRDPDREAVLAKYWSAAAIPMAHVDPALAQRCDLKAEYWLNPDGYNADTIKDLDIGLESVRNAYRTLLKPRSLMQRPELNRGRI